MTGNVPPIDEMPALKERLGKARTDRIRYAQQGDPQPLKRAVNLTNTVISAMQYITPHKPGCRITDVLTGIARLDGDRIPLSVDRLFTLFQCLPLINSREIAIMTGLNKRQAHRYMQAAKIALPHLEQIIVKNGNGFDPINPYQSQHV